MADNALADLDHALQPIAQQWLQKCNAEFKTRIIITWRNPTDQDAAFNKGLSNARAGHSAHNCCTVTGVPASRAFDFAIYYKDGTPITDGTHPYYARAGAIGKELGLVWGGDWHKPDYDHLEMANWKTMEATA